MVLPGYCLLVANVYSTLLLSKQGLNGALDIPCPAGFRMVIRDLDVYCDNSGAGGTFFFKGNVNQTIWHLSLAAFATTDGQWRGRQVIDYPDSASVVADTNSDVTVSGYLLSLP